MVAAAAFRSNTGKVRIADCLKTDSGRLAMNEPTNREVELLRRRLPSVTHGLGHQPERSENSFEPFHTTKPKELGMVA